MSSAFFPEAGATSNGFTGATAASLRNSDDEDEDDRLQQAAAAAACASSSDLIADDSDIDENLFDGEDLDIVEEELDNLELVD